MQLAYVWLVSLCLVSLAALAAATASCLVVIVLAAVLLCVRWRVVTTCW